MLHVLIEYMCACDVYEIEKSDTYEKGRVHDVTSIQMFYRY